MRAVWIGTQSVNLKFCQDLFCTLRCNATWSFNLDDISSPLMWIWMFALIILLNRLSKVECCEALKPNGESICALGPNCGNRLFEKRAYAKVRDKQYVKEKGEIECVWERQKEKVRERERVSEWVRERGIYVYIHREREKGGNSSFTLTIFFWLVGL